MTPATDPALHPSSDRALEAAWAEHLLAGGTTGWSEFRAAPGGVGEPLWVGPVPGAQNLELLRRLNLSGPIGERAGRAVLAASLPGRGKPDLRLPGAEQPRWGFPPMDPATLPDLDLIRVVTGFLASRLAGMECPPAQHRPARRWARQYDLAGDRWAGAQYLDQLSADGRPPGGPAAHVLVLGAGLDELLAAQWAWRSHREPVNTWRHWLRHVADRPTLPTSVDLAAQAARAAARVGRRRVHLVLDPAALPDLLGSRHLSAPAPISSAAAVDLARHVSTAMVVRVPAERRHRLVWEILRPQAAHLGGAPLRMPAEAQAWVEERATRMVRQLADAGYPVHGDLSTLLPSPASPAGDLAPGRGASDRATLALGMRLLRQWVGADTSTNTDSTNTDIGE